MTYINAMIDCLIYDINKISMYICNVYRTYAYQHIHGETCVCKYIHDVYIKSLYMWYIMQNKFNSIY